MQDSSLFIAALNLLHVIYQIECEETNTMNAKYRVGISPARIDVRPNSSFDLTCHMYGIEVQYCNEVFLQGKNFTTALKTLVAVDESG